jgi:hypothetical protein
MKLQKWSDIRRKKLSDAELAELDQRVAAEVLELNRTAPQETFDGLTPSKPR